MKRGIRGLHFQTVSGNNYFYDDRSGLCFPCTMGLKSAIAGLGTSRTERLTGLAEPGLWDEFITERDEAYGAFLESNRVHLPPCTPDAQHMRTAVERSGFLQLILVVTTNCNLRCHYCILSEKYPYEKSPGPERMPQGVAFRAIDYYLRMLARIRNRDPARAAVISFYGGEPLLNLDVIEKAVEYVRNLGERNVRYSLSTNGTLLSQEVADFLVANKFLISVSLDGPKQEHDRNRVNDRDGGTFDLVYGNLERFWKRYPKYKELTFLVTYDCKTNLHELRYFFNSRREFMRSLWLFTPVSPHFTEYYGQFSDRDRQKFALDFDELKALMQTSCDWNDPLLRHLIGMPYVMLLFRRILLPPARPEFAGTGACLPGSKLCVVPDGGIYPCEKVPGLPNIGSIYTGLDYETIADLVGSYNSSITGECPDCPISRICGTCFANFWSGNQFRKPTDSFCKDQIALRRRLLAEAYSLLEEHPEFYSDMMAKACRCHC